MTNTRNTVYLIHATNHSDRLDLDDILIYSSFLRPFRGPWFTQCELHTYRMMYLKLGTRSIVLTTIYLIALLSLAASQLDSAHGQVVDQRNRQVKSSDKIDSPASNGVKSESVTLSKSTPDHKESNGDTFSPPDPNGAHASISPSANVYTIEGKVSGPPGLDLDTDSAWLVQTRVIVNYGERVSHLK